MKRKQRPPKSKVRETKAKYRSLRRLSATEASRNFSDLLNRTLYRGESFIVERAGEPACEIRPAALPHFTVADLAELMRDLPPIDEDYLSTVEDMVRSQPWIPVSPWER
jgi:hypothetical protein